MRRLAFGSFLALSLAALAAPLPAAEEVGAADGDPQALAVARRTIERMGGAEAWNAARQLSWRFFDRRTHFWDKWTGDVRIEADDTLVLMNINSRTGRVWKGGQEVTEPAALAQALEQGYGWWVNDSYWMFMPFKLLDPGVHLAYRGVQPTGAGHDADVLDLTFGPVGLTPENRYLVSVVRMSGLVEQWSYFKNASDADPAFTGPWERWAWHGDILLPGGHGRGMDWHVAVYDELPRAVYTDVTLPALPAPRPVARVEE